MLIEHFTVKKTSTYHTSCNEYKRSVFSRDAPGAYYANEPMMHPIRLTLTN